MLSTADGIVHHSIHRLREILADIYPLHVEQTDLARAVDELAEPLRRRGVRVTVLVSGTQRLAPETKTMLYRTARELLRNVENHARAKNVNVEVSTDGEGAEIRVADDGVGFDAALGLPATGHVGLVILMDTVRDHGGEFTLTSAPGDGCTVVVSSGPATWPRRAPG